MEEIKNADIMRTIIFTHFGTVANCAKKMKGYETCLRKALSQNLLSEKLCKEIGNLVGMDLMYLANGNTGSSKKVYAKNKLLKEMELEKIEIEE